MPHRKFKKIKAKINHKESAVQKNIHDIILGLASNMISLPIHALLNVIEATLVGLLELSDTSIQNHALGSKVMETICSNPQILIYGVIIEEILYRGLIRSGLESLLEIITNNLSIAKYGSSILSSGLFAARHGYGGMSARFFDGLIYDFLKDKTDNLITPTAAHFAHNLIPYTAHCVLKQ